MILEELQHTTPWSKLTAKEKTWLTEYLTSRDLMIATRAAYNTSTDDSTRSYGRSLLGKTHILAIIDLFDGKEDHEPTLEEFRKVVYQSAIDDPKTRASLLGLYANLRGWTKSNRSAQNTKADEFDPLEDLSYGDESGTCDTERTSSEEKEPKEVS